MYRFGRLALFIKQGESLFRATFPMQVTYRSCGVPLIAVQKCSRGIFFFSEERGKLFTVLETDSVNHCYYGKKKLCTSISSSGTMSDTSQIGPL